MPINDWYQWEIIQNGKSFGLVPYFELEAFVQRQREQGLMTPYEYEFKLRRIDLSQEEIDRLVTAHQEKLNERNSIETPKS